MHIEKYQSNGTDCLRLVRTVRVRDKNGKSVNRKAIVKTFGPLSRYDDGKPDYLLRLRQSFIEKNPLIEALLPYVEQAPKKKYVITFEEGTPYCSSHPKYFAPCLLDPVFAFLGLDEFFASVKHASKIAYDLQGIIRLLAYGRLLDPSSKMATMRQNESYYKPLVKSSNDTNVYDALDIVYANRGAMIQRMNTCIAKGIGRNPDTVVYDVTNCFVEIERPDEDERDAEGTVVGRGLRKMGVSKEHRKQPIVQMGLFMDDKGIPVSIEMFPGNTLDHQTLRAALKNTVSPLALQRFILVADRGMYNGTNMCHVVDQGDGYIVSKSLRKSTRKERKWVTDPEGYTIVSPDFKYKSRIVTRSVKGEDGKARKIREKVVVYWSRAFYLRERHENKTFLEFMDKLKANPNGFRLTAAQSRSLRKFMKKEVVHKDTGEILDSRKLLSMIDEDKLTEFNELMGYYQIVSSELEMQDTAIIDRYHGLTRIEDQFREMKGTLETRPVYVNTPEHIQAHILVCFIALTMMRIIQYALTHSLASMQDSTAGWSYGMTGHRLAKALRSWTVDPVSDEYFRMSDVQTGDMKKILDAVHLSVPLQLFTRGQLRTLKSSVKLF